MTRPCLNNRAVNSLYIVGYVLASEKKTQSQLTQNPQNIFIRVLYIQIFKYDCPIDYRVYIEYIVGVSITFEYNF